LHAFSNSAKVSSKTVDSFFNKMLSADDSFDFLFDDEFGMLNSLMF
jgi:hypothetical protein